MTPQRRSALVSVVAAAVLVLLKLGAGLGTHSLGLISEAAHSGTDLVAALLTYFAVRVAARPARRAAPPPPPTSRTSSAMARPSISPRLPRPRRWRSSASSSRRVRSS